MTSNIWMGELWLIFFLSLKRIIKRIIYFQTSFKKIVGEEEGNKISHYIGGNTLFFYHKGIDGWEEGGSQNYSLIEIFDQNERGF